MGGGDTLGESDSPGIPEAVVDHAESSRCVFVVVRKPAGEEEFDHC
jgi:hypothetical protein